MIIYKIKIHLLFILWKIKKSDTKTTVTLKAGNNIRKNSNNNFKESIPNNWFEIF